MPDALPCPSPRTAGAHVAETVRLAAPLAVAQLMQMAMGVTNTVLLGTLGGPALAAGGLGGTIEISVLVILQGVLTAVSVLVSQAVGAGDARAVPALYWTGHVLTALLVVPAFALFSFAEALLLLTGQPPELARDTGEYLLVLRWAAPGLLFGTGLMRAFLPAVGAGRAILLVTVGQALANLALCWALVGGAGWAVAVGLPTGLRGAAAATVVVSTGGALALLLFAHVSAAVRPHVRAARPGGAILLAMLRLGVPVCGTFAVESGLFLAVALIMGALGPAALAGQQVALNVTAVCFMIPLGLAQAANIRVGNHVGAGDAAGARRAGLVAIALGGGVEFVEAAVVVLFAPGIAGLFLRPEEPGFPIAVSLLHVAALFQVADGVQTVASGALRGLGDTRVPFLLAAGAYWGLGFPAALLLALLTPAGPEGTWYGLAAALIAVAALLTLRFLRRSRAGVHPTDVHRAAALV